MKKSLVTVMIAALSTIMLATSAYADLPDVYTSVIPDELYTIDVDSLTEDELRIAYNRLRDTYATCFQTLVEESAKNDELSKPTPTPKPTTAPKKKKTKTTTTVAKKYGPGQLKIGSDIPAGEYVLFPSESGHAGFFFESRDANQDDVTNSGSFDYSAIITIKSGNYLELSNAYAIPISSNPKIDKTKPGCFKAGLHISAGEYKVIPFDNGRTAFYFIYTDSTMQDVVSCDSFDNQAYVTVKNGQILELKNAVIDW